MPELAAGKRTLRVLCDRGVFALNCFAVVLLAVCCSASAQGNLKSLPPPPPPLKLKPKASVDAPPKSSSETSQEITAGDVLSIRTTEVLLPVTVRDREGQLVTTLTRNDFRVYEDGRQQPLTDFAVRDVPVDVVLMVDASSSVSANLDDFRRAADGFAEKLWTGDRVCLIKFDDRVELLQDWTLSRTQLRRSLRRVEPGIFTRFNDALLLAAKDQLKSNRSRHAVIVLTDGIDSGRGYSTIADALREFQTGIGIGHRHDAERLRRQQLHKLFLLGFLRFDK